MPGLRRKVPTRTSVEPEPIVVAGHEIAISNPTKVLFPKPEYTKLDLVRYYLAVAEGAPRGLGSSARREVAAGARRGTRGPSRAWRLRAHRLAENVRLARHARPRAHRTALDL